MNEAKRLETSRLSRVVTRAPLLMALAVAWLALCVWIDFPGILTAFQLLYLAASLLSLRDYRSERGLWMLALLHFGVSVVLYAVFLVEGVRDQLRGAAVPIRLGVDVALMSIVLGWQVRCLWSVGVANYRFSRTV